MKPDRRSGYFDPDKETMSADARRRYQSAWLRALMNLAWERAPGTRRRLEEAGLAPADLGDPDALARLPVLKKSRMPDLQKADPPFGGFCTVPLSEVRRIFGSPGPIFEPVGQDSGRPVEPFGRVGDDSVHRTSGGSFSIHRFCRFVVRRCLSGVVRSMATSQSSHHRSLFRGGHGVAATLHTVDGDRILGLLR